MCKQICHTVRENALTMNCSLIFKSKRQYIVHLFFYFFSLTIKDKIKILHLGQGSFTRKVRTIFSLKNIVTDVSIFVKLFLILVLHLRQFFIVRIFVKRATVLEQNSLESKLKIELRGCHYVVLLRSSNNNNNFLQCSTIYFLDKIIYPCNYNNQYKYNVNEKKDNSFLYICKHVI